MTEPNYIVQFLELKNAGIKPTSARYRRMAEGSKITRKQARTLTATKWVAAILIYGTIAALVAWLI